MPNTPILRAPFTFDKNGEAATVIEQIYTTKGDNLYNHDNIKCDKMIGLVIKGQIYWLQDSFANLYEIEHLLHRLNVTISKCGRWGATDEDGSTTYTNSITKLNKHHDDLFSDKSNYVKRAKFNESNGKRSLWWTINEVVNELFSTPMDAEPA